MAGYAGLPVSSHRRTNSAQASASAGVTVFISGKKNSFAGTNKYSTSENSAIRRSPNRSRTNK